MRKCSFNSCVFDGIVYQIYSLYRSVVTTDSYYSKQFSHADIWWISI